MAIDNFARFMATEALSNKTDILLLKENALMKNQGSENVGKILVVGTDGNLVLTDMPEGGASGDVTGVLDENNDILLTGELADGVYVLKYKNDNGTYTDAGTLNVGSISEEEPLVNLISTALDLDVTNIYNSKGYKENVRWSFSVGGETGITGGILTGLIPIGEVGDIFRTNGLDYKTDSKFYGQVYFLDENGTYTVTSRTDLLDKSAFFTDDDGEDAFVFVPSLIPANSYYFRIVFGTNGVTNPILTRNQHITG